MIQLMILWTAVVGGLVAGASAWRADSVHGGRFAVPIGVYFALITFVVLEAIGLVARWPLW